MNTTTAKHPLPLFLLTLSAFSLLAFTPMIADGLGQITTPIVEEDLMQGAEFTQEIVPFNSANREMVFDLRANGDIEGWATFYEADDTNLENSVGHINVSPGSYGSATALFKIPEGTPNGVYKGNVVVAARESKEEEEETEEGITTSVLQRSSRAVTITVTDEEVINLEGRAMPNDFDIPRGDALDLRFIYRNLGNISIKPDARVRIMEYDSETIEHEAIYPYPSNENPTRPRERKELTYVSWPTAEQSLGRYRVDVDFMIDGEIYDSDNFRFSINSKNFGSWGASLALLSGGNFWTGSLIALTLGALLIGGAVVSIKRTINKQYSLNGSQQRPNDL